MNNNTFATKNIMLMGLFVALMVISSYIVIPIGPVPITLQIFVVLLAGILLGSKLGPMSIIAWMLLGIIGLPVFNQGQGGAVMLVGPTGGFIVAFVVMAWFVGYCTESNKGDSIKFMALVMVIAIVICYVLGIIGFKLSFAYFLHKPMTWTKAFVLAVAPFLPFDIIKAVLASFIGVKVRSALQMAGLITK
jgi:biotin transport system substrate-specific component